MTAPYFQIETGAEKKRLEFPVGSSEFVIGRSPACELVITSGQVSRRHARVLWRSGKATIEDLGSSNGTFVNGRRLDQPTALKSEDRVSLGTVDLKFVMPAPAQVDEATVFAPQRRKATVELPRAAAVEAPGSGSREAEAPKPVAPPPAVPPPSFIPRASAVATPDGPARVAPVPSSAPPAANPSVVELVMIALGSFLAVFGIGAALIRFF